MSTGVDIHAVKRLISDRVLHVAREQPEQEFTTGEWLVELRFIPGERWVVINTKYFHSYVETNIPWTFNTEHAIALLADLSVHVPACEFQIRNVKTGVIMPQDLL